MLFVNTDDMERREFLKKSALLAAAAAITPNIMNASEKSSWTPAAQVVPGSDFEINSDVTKDGVRTVVATPSELVCSKRIDISIDTATGTILSAKFTRGCPGNALGVCSLIKGMKVSEVIARLDGIDCAGRGTSCPDQLARVLKSLK